MMPFVRLLTIYVVVILAVVAFFQRDKVMDLMGMSSQSSQPQESAHATPVAKTPDEPDEDVLTPAQGDTSVSAADVTPSEPIAAPEPVPLAPIVQPTAQAQPAIASDDIQSRLAEARQAYWGGDMDITTELYMALASDAPENADTNGELGNILYSQGRYAEAADYYFIAGKLLVADQKLEQAGQLLGVLQSLAPQKADALRALANK